MTYESLVKNRLRAARNALQGLTGEMVGADVDKPGFEEDAEYPPRDIKTDDTDDVLRKTGPTVKAV